MSKIFTRLYTGDTVASGEGKCFRKLAPDLTETWLWNSTITGFPEYTMHGNSQDDIEAFRKLTTCLVDFNCNGIKYNAIQYFSVKVYDWPNAPDGYAMRGFIYYKDFNPETGKISSDGVAAYAIEDNYTQGWGSSAYRTLTYTSIPKDTQFVAFRKTNAVKTATSVLSVMNDKSNVDTSIMSVLAKK